MVEIAPWTISRAQVPSTKASAKPDSPENPARAAAKAFFFEKKKQKTFDPSVSPPIWHKSNDRKFQKQEFFGSRRAGAAFFSKKNCFLRSPGGAKTALANRKGNFIAWARALVVGWIAAYRKVTTSSNSFIRWRMRKTIPNPHVLSGNLAVRVVRRANGIPGPEVFELFATPLPECPPGGVLLRVLNAGVDPAMRGWLSAEKNYATVPDGAVMRALGVGEVIESRSADWAVGMAAYGWLGWQRYAAVPATELLWQADLEAAPPETWISIFGLNGLTAWIGLTHLGRPKPGETVLVTTASGGVGGVAGQLAAAAGLRAVGLAGGPEKVARATAELGYAAAIDYRAQGDLAAAIAAACPAGIDVYSIIRPGHWLTSSFPI
jgi:hypothetical protein